MENNSELKLARLGRSGLLLGLSALIWSAGCAEDQAGLADDLSPILGTPDASVGSDASSQDGSDGADGSYGSSDEGGPVDSPWCKVKAVLDRRCAACHDGQGTGPLKLTSHAELIADSPQHPGTKVYLRVKERVHASGNPMPPQSPLASDELAAIDAWVAAGAPAGDNHSCTAVGRSPDAGTEAPASDWPADCEKFWKITAHDPSDPSKPYRFPANTEDHPGLVFDAPWGDEEVQALAFRPITDNRKILHHWILYANNGGPLSRPFLTGWSPGKDEREPLPPDVGMYMPRGKQSLYLDLHYYNRDAPGSASKEELDASGVEICTVSKAKFRKQMATVTMSFRNLPILSPLVPARVNNHRATATCTVSASGPVTLLTASPHAHKLAVGMEFSVTKKNGTTIQLYKDTFNFEEQGSYSLEPPVIIESGDKVTTTCIYSNPTGPAVYFGEDTANEMCFNFAVYYPMSANLRCN